MFDFGLLVCCSSVIVLVVVVVLFSSDVFEIVRFVRLVIICWKFRSVLRWFWEILGWYGV